MKHISHMARFLSAAALSLVLLASGASKAHAITSWDVHNEPQMYLDTSISPSQTASIKIAAPILNGQTVNFTTTTGGMLRLRSGTKQEDIYFSTGSVNSSTKVITLYGVTRNVCRQYGREIRTCGNGQQFNRGSIVELSIAAQLLNWKANIDRANTFSASGAISFSNSGSLALPTFADITSRNQQLGATPPGPARAACVTATGACYYYIGNQWVSFGSGAQVNATQSIAGKVQLATVKDQSGAVALGSTGAPTVVQTRYLTGTGGTAERYGRIPFLLRAGILTGSVLGTGNQYANSGKTHVSGTGAWIADPPTPNTFYQCVAGTGSNIISGTVAETNFTKNCNLTGSTLAAGDMLLLDYSFISRNQGGSNSAVVKVKFDTTNILTFSAINPVDSTPYVYAGSAVITFRSIGSTAQIVSNGILQSVSTGSTTISRTNGGVSASVPVRTYDMTTNPKLIISGTMGSATAGNSMQMLTLSVRRVTNPTQLR